MARSGRKIDDLTGRRFGRLTVTGMAPYRQGKHIVWECRCDCGGTKAILAGSLKQGKATSYGCRHRERMRELWRSRQEKAMAERLEREAAEAARRREEYRRAQAERNAMAGEAFDDFWMFGHEGRRWFNKFII